uniref:Ectonucleotide pyrophosphatase/phosphodiesterase family member 6 n=1 Tax=Plectus sambesii TaxID=2011161 RepID=A0A914XHP2_9BILA
MAYVFIRPTGIGQRVESDRGRPASVRATARAQNDKRAVTAAERIEEESRPPPPPWPRPASLAQHLTTSRVTLRRRSPFARRPALHVREFAAAPIVSATSAARVRVSERFSQPLVPAGARLRFLLLWECAAEGRRAKAKTNRSSHWARRSVVPRRETNADACERPAIDARSVVSSSVSPPTASSQSSPPKMSQRREPLCSLSTSCRLLVFLLFSLAMVANSRAAEALGQNVILLMIDGFANKFLNTTGPLNGFERMAEHGVQAEYLKPSFPSLSFPNWQSLATGLYVENHGFTGNFMYDPASDMKFLIGIGPNDTDQLWWNQSEPLWYIAGKGNVNVHCYWWGGCHVPHKDVVVQVPPPRVLNFSNEFQTDALANYFDDIVKMIRIYEPYRRQLVMAYFASVDIQGHYYGPSSPETVDQVRKANDLVNALQDKLEKADLFDSTNLIVLSDHGQIDLDRDEKYYIDECLSDHSKIVAVVDCYASMLVIAKPEYVDEVGSILISVDIGPIYFELNTCDQWAQNEYEDDEGAAPPVKAYRVNKLPERFHFKNARFLPAIVLLARPGASVLT